MADAVEGTISQVQYDEKKVPQWINDICEKTMKNLNELGRPYKYISKPCGVAHRAFVLSPTQSRA